MLSKWSSWFSLFASTGTLLCCAIPSLLVVLGLGSTLASLIGVFPQLIWVSQYKEFVFAVSGVFILNAGSLRYYNRNQACPIDIKLAQACRDSRHWSFRILILSFILWFIGFFFAFVAPQLF